MNDGQPSSICQISGISETPGDQQKMPSIKLKGCRRGKHPEQFCCYNNLWMSKVQHGVLDTNEHFTNTRYTDMCVNSRSPEGSPQGHQQPSSPNLTRRAWYTLLTICHEYIRDEGTEKSTYVGFRRLRQQPVFSCIWPSL